MLWNHSHSVCAGPGHTISPFWLLTRPQLYKSCCTVIFSCILMEGVTGKTVSLWECPSFRFISTNIHSFWAGRDIVTGNRLNLRKVQWFLFFQFTEASASNSQPGLFPLSLWSTGQLTASHSSEYHNCLLACLSLCSRTRSKQPWQLREFARFQ